MASDSRYLCGAIGTLAGIRLAVPLETRLEVVFLHDRLSGAEQQRVLRAMARLRGEVAIQFLQVGQSFEQFPEFFYDSKLTYARLVLPEMVNWQRLIYIDVDLLVLRDLSELATVDLPETGVGGVAEKTLAGDMPARPPVPLDPDQPYLNAGLLVLDLQQIRSFGTFRKAIDILQHHPDCCHWHDQSAINYVLNGNTALLDRSWNVQTKHLAYDPVAIMPALQARSLNVHFIHKAKPWLATTPFAADEMFRILLDEVDPGWRDDPVVRAAMARAKERFSRAMPALFAARGWLSLLNGKCGFWDFREAEIWSDHNRHLRHLRARKQEFDSLLADWRSRIQAGKVRE